MKLGIVVLLRYKDIGLIDKWINEYEIPKDSIIFFINQYKKEEIEIVSDQVIDYRDKGINVYTQSCGSIGLAYLRLEALKDLHTRWWLLCDYYLMMAGDDQLSINEFTDLYYVVDKEIDYGIDIIKFNHYYKPSIDSKIIKYPYTNIETITIEDGNDPKHLLKEGHYNKVDFVIYSRYALEIAGNYLSFSDSSSYLKKIYNCDDVIVSLILANEVRKFLLLPNYFGTYIKSEDSLSYTKNKSIDDIYKFNIERSNLLFDILGKNLRLKNITISMINIIKFNYIKSLLNELIYYINTKVLTNETEKDNNGK